MINILNFNDMKHTLFISIAFLLITCSCSKNEIDIIVPDPTVEDNKPKPIEIVGTAYYISQAGITDHSNAATEKSIAWYFKTYGSGNTYILNTDENTYNLNNTITVPAQSIFRGNTGMVGKIAASSTADNKTLIDLTSGTKLINMDINGAKYASILVKVDNKDSITIDSCTIYDSKNNYTSGSPYTMLLYFISSANVIVEHCKLLRAGWPKENPTLWSGLGYLILSRSCYDMTFQNNEMSYSITGGIDMTGSSSIKILYNSISYTGLNREFSGSISDGITAYHNWNSRDENFIIKGNKISYAGNHGIHVSGKNIDIQNNTISNQQLSAIMVDDWRSKTNGGGAFDNEFSENVMIKNNKCGDPLSWVWQPGNSNRKIYVDRVNSGPGITLDYSTNQDLSAVTLDVISSNYHIPSIFGIHQ